LVFKIKITSEEKAMILCAFTTILDSETYDLIISKLNGFLICVEFLKGQASCLQQNIKLNIFVALTFNDSA
jgi:hypothetical protein